MQRSDGFRTLLVVRGLTVINDNLSRWLIIGLGKRAASIAGTSPAAVLALGTVFYVLPFVLFAWLAGWLADRFPKRSVAIADKLAEVFIGLTTGVVIAWGAASGGIVGGMQIGLWMLFGVIGLFAIQTTLLNPSLIGTIPETVPASRLSSANGIFALVTLAATLIGMSCGNWLADITLITPKATLGFAGWNHALPAVVALVGVACVGWLVARKMLPVEAAASEIPFPKNALSATLSDLKNLFSTPRLAASAGGIVYFWAIGAVVQLNVDQYAFESGATSQTQVIPLLLALVIGIGFGSLLAGFLSKRGIETDSKVDLGIVPIGSLVMTVACLALWLSSKELFDGVSSPALQLFLPVLFLALLGVGAGLFDVPLEAYLQEQSPPARRGAVLASTNMLVFAGMFIASIGYYGLRMPIGSGEAVRPLFSARGVFGVFSILSALAMLISVFLAPRSSLRILVAAIVHSVWRFRVHNENRIPLHGSLVMVANHVSFLDGFLLPLTSLRPVRMVVYGPNIRGRVLKKLADQWRFILFEPRPKSIGRALKTIQTGLSEGDCIGIFCEGGISRTGQILGFKRGLQWLLDGVQSPILPVHIDGMWGSVLSFSEGRFFRKRPRGIRRTVNLHFGTPLPVGTSPHDARLAVQELSALSVNQRMMSQAHSPVSGISLRQWAVLRAIAEAFDGCCLVRRNDTLVSSLSDDSVLHASVGHHSKALLGIQGTVVECSVSSDQLADRIMKLRPTIWLASVEQVAALSTTTSALHGGVIHEYLDAIVMSLTSSDELPAAQAASSAFAAAFGIEPVTAFEPSEVRGLVAMNTPPSRIVNNEVTLKRDSVGRVVNGAVVWPRATDRNGLGQVALPDSEGLASGASLAIGATLCGELSGEDIPEGEPGRGLLATSFDVDSDGFLSVRET